MRLKNTSSFHERILVLATPCSGGVAAILSSQISCDLLTISSQYNLLDVKFTRLLNIYHQVLPLQ